MKKIYFLIILFILTLSIASCSMVKFLGYRTKEPQIIFREGVKEEILRRKIDGAEIESEDAANLYPVAVMIENAADSWPASGLDKANLVIEAITEAAITRFVAFYATDSEVKKIGPVRSARPYYLDWIDPYGSLYLHVGGSPDALAKIKSGNYSLTDLNQFWNDQYFWRDKWRYAPHNVYTSSEFIQKALADKKLDEPANYETWQYKKDLELEKRPEQINDVAINFAAQYYKVRWQYNREENNYIRYQNGEIHKMSDGEWIKAKNIIVQVNDMIVIDEVGRKKITTIGEGQAWIFRDGEIVEGRWVKESPEKQIKYFDKNDKEIEFNGGTTWIEVIPDEDYLRY